MAITQGDRDRLEDLGLDPMSDRTEEMRTPLASAGVGAPGQGRSEHPSTVK